MGKARDALKPIRKLLQAILWCRTGSLFPPWAYLQEGGGNLPIEALQHQHLGLHSLPTARFFEQKGG